MTEFARQGGERTYNPLTAFLRSERGMTLKGWASINGFSYGMTNHVVNGGHFDAVIVPALREQGLYEKLPLAIRKLIEADEQKREAKQNA